MSKSLRMSVGSRAGRLVSGMLLLGALLVLTPAQVPAASGDRIIRPDAPEVYEVKKGDTLWDIAGTFLVEPWRWPDIWRVNPDIENPHLIYPGDSIRLRYVDGEPTLDLSRGRAGRSVRLTPDDTVQLEPRIRSTPLLNAIPAIDLDAIGPFLSSNRVVTQDELEDGGYVLEGHDGRILMGAGDDAYIRNFVGQVGESLSVVRRGDMYVDPDTGEELGLEAEEIGTARVVDIGGDVDTVRIASSRSEIRRGDRLLPFEERTMATTFFPSAPEMNVDGSMLSVLGGVTQIGQFSVVALNLGERDGIEVGHVLAINRQGRLVKDEIENNTLRMPSRRAGLLMVFRTFERLSYGIVLEARLPLAVNDEVTNP